MKERQVRRDPVAHYTEEGRGRRKRSRRRRSRRVKLHRYLISNVEKTKSSVLVRFNLIFKYSSQYKQWILLHDRETI